MSSSQSCGMTHSNEGPSITYDSDPAKTPHFFGDEEGLIEEMLANAEQVAERLKRGSDHHKLVQFLRQGRMDQAVPLYEVLFQVTITR